jgi:hypothetical protein
MKKLAILALPFLLSGCPQAAKNPERAAIRGVIITLAQAVVAIDLTCADIAKRKMNAEMADKCDEGFAIAKSSIQSASLGIDAYDDVKAGEIVCFVAHTRDALEDMADVITEAGGNVPAVGLDALSLAKGITCGR